MAAPASASAGTRTPDYDFDVVKLFTIASTFWGIAAFLDAVEDLLVDEIEMALHVGLVLACSQSLREVAERP